MYPLVVLGERSAYKENITQLLCYVETQFFEKRSGNERIEKFSHYKLFEIKDSVHIQLSDHCKLNKNRWGKNIGYVLNFTTVSEIVLA